MPSSPTITLRQLDCLRAVVEGRSLSAAARSMHVTAGGISLAITELERQLEVQLILRTRGRGVEVTPAGRAVYDHACEVAAGIDRIRHIAATLRGELSGPLRLGLFTTLSPWFLPPIAEHISTAFPSIDLEVVEDGSAGLQAALREGRLDAALIYRNHLAAGIEGHDIVPARLQVAVSASHPLAERDAVRLRDLEDEDGALLAIQPAGDHVEELLRATGMTPRIAWRSANVETIRSLVARGLAYTIIMGRPYGDVTYEGLPIVYRPIADELPENAVVLALAQGLHESANLRELLRFCRAEFTADTGTTVMGALP